MGRFHVLGLVLALAVGGARSANAQPVDDATRAAARNLATEGVQAYQANNFSVASEKLGRAYRALHAPSLGLWSARALVKVGRLVEAGERYREVTRLEISGGDEAVQKQAKVDAQLELDALTPRIPSVVVQVEGADPSDVSVAIDGVSLNSALIGAPRPIDPGSHQVIGTSGAEKVQVTVLVAESEHKSALLQFSEQARAAAAPVTARSAAAADTAAAPVAVNSPSAPAASAAPPASHSAHSLRTVGVITIGAGIAALAVGSVFGLSAKGSNDKSNADGHCDATGCDGTGLADRNDALRAARMSTGLFIAGGALVAGGVTLYLVGGPHSESTSLAIMPFASVNAASLRISGGF